jgi:GAG-pre-integrase domain
VQGFGNTLTTITHTGTIIWSIDDDNGHTHVIHIKNAYYVPGSRIRLLSPQQWAQTVEDTHPNNNGTWCGTYHDRVMLYRNQQQHLNTIMLDKSTYNVATMWTTPNIQGYKAFINDVIEADISAYAYPSEIPVTQFIEDDQCPIDNDHDIQIKKSNIPYTNDEVTLDEEMQDSHISSSLSEELLMWHRRYGHLSMTRVQRMAAQGILPRKLATCPIPICQA